MDVNYLIEINGLDDWEFGNPLSATAYKVMRKLLMIANRQRFPERIPISNTRLCFLVGCTEKSLIAARQQLIQRGLIDYKGKKKQTPVYTIHYFSHDPRYNRKNYSYDGGIDGSIDGGIDGSIDVGYEGGRSLNNTYGGMEECEEEDSGNNNQDLTTGVQTPVDIRLHNPSPTLPSVDVLQGRGFPPRNRTLAGAETWAYTAAMSFLDNPTIRRMYGDGHRIVKSALESDVFPVSLVGYAMDKTYQRNRMYPEPLGNPAAYTIRLLNDWKEQGFNCPEDVQESKDDWMHFG